MVAGLATSWDDGQNSCPSEQDGSPSGLVWVLKINDAQQAMQGQKNNIFLQKEQSDKMTVLTQVIVVGIRIPKMGP